MYIFVTISVFFEYDADTNMVIGDCMSKTIVIDENIHTLVIEKQSEIREKYDINLKISYMVGSILKHYIDKMEDILKNEISGGSNISDSIEEK